MTLENRRISRREFLKMAGVGLAATGLASCAPPATTPGAAPAAVEAPAQAQSTELKIIQWSHFVPEYDQWFDEFASKWGEENGITVTIDHIPHLELPARAAAEVAAQAGHDLFGFSGAGGPHLYIKHLVDLSDLINEFVESYGEVTQIGRQIAYDTETDTWSALPNYYIRFPGLYRKDLWDEIGMVPDTWDDLLEGGRKLKEMGHPVGIGLAHHVDSNLSWRGVIWSFGGSIQDETGTEVTINSPETLEAIKFVRALYQEAMTEEVLAWDDSSNNRFLASGKGCYIHNPISAYRSIQKTDPELADKIYLWKTPAGPATRLVGGSPNSYGVWKFSPNVEAALSFLRHYSENWEEGFKASTGYNHPIFNNIVPSPMPILSNDPSSNPPDKLKVLETANEWHAVYGYPGPGTPAAEEVVNNFIIPDMMANAATDKMTPEEALAWAEEQIVRIYKKWQT